MNPAPLEPDYSAPPASVLLWAIGLLGLLSALAWFGLDELAVNSVGALNNRLSEVEQEGLRDVVKVITSFADNEPLILLLLVALVVFCERWLAITAFLAMGTGSIISETLKAVVSRARPDGGRSLRSFPSGHAVAAFAAALVLSRRFPRLRSAFFFSAALVALSRVLLVKHFVSDVLAGAALGLVAGLAGIALSHRIRRVEEFRHLRLLCACILVPLSVFWLWRADSRGSILSVGLMIALVAVLAGAMVGLGRAIRFVVGRFQHSRSASK